MDASRWQRVAEIFDAAADAPAHERTELLQRLCAGDAEIRREVEALLAADARAEVFERGVDAARNTSAAAWVDADERAAHGDARIGPWRLVRELGRGGMGVVWLAQRADGDFEQRAALKLIKRGMDTDAVEARFLRERRILARLQHPHIAHLLDGGIAADGRPYFAMEFVDGQPLLDFCADARLDLAGRICLFLQICAAVQFAHGQLVVHRDIKPSNILVAADGSAKLLDFGIAKLLDDSSDGHTATVDALHRPLTPAYAAPEQLRGEAATTATDIYALGGVLYELLTGHRPLALSDASSPAEILRAQDTTDPAAPSRVVNEQSPVPSRWLRGDLDTIVLKALQREPQRRYATAAALADDLQRFLSGQPIAARRDHAGYRLRKFVGRHRLGVAAAACGLIVLVAALGVALWQAQAKAREAMVSQQVTQFLIGLFGGADPTQARGATLTAQDLLDQGTQRLHENAAIDATVRARLLHTVTVTYTNLGLYDRALPLAQQALALRRAQSDPLELAESELQLGRILRLKSDFTSAEPLLRDALRLRTAHLPADDPAISESLDELGLLLGDRGQFAAADAPFRAARESAERHYGTGAIETARYIDDYASNLDSQGQRRDALALYRQTLAIREKQLGPDAADVASSLLNLGTHLDESGRYDEAKPLLERALAIRRKIFGDAHPLVGFAQIGLASVYEDDNRLDAAEKLAQEALAVFRAALPADHPKVSEALNLLVTVHVARRDYVGAVPLAQEVLARFDKTLGEDHPSTLTAKNNLAYALLHSGRSAQAEQLQRDVLAHQPVENGQPVEPTANENLASTLIVEGKFAEAVGYAQRAVEIQKAREGEVSGNTAVALNGLGVAEQLNGASADAERDFRAALAIGEILHATQNIDLFQWRLPLADFLVGAKRCAEAVPLLELVVGELKPRMPLRDPLPLAQAHLLLGHCRGGADGAAMQAGAREALRAMPAVAIDMYPQARKLLATARR
ncbi:MAG: serine/threonine protein kinase [Proteobacteria bacterium]|nr:serine/threonine protein kinase [Pseudomonadota bacterium]